MGGDAFSFFDQGFDVKEQRLIIFRIKHDERLNWEERLMMEGNKNVKKDVKTIRETVNTEMLGVEHVWTTI